MLREVRLSFVAAIAACVLGWQSVAYAHGDVMRIGSTQAGGGQLRIESEFDFDLDVHTTEMGGGGGVVLYQAIIPSFSWVLGPNESGLLPLPEGTRLTFVLQQVTAGASVRLNSRLLDEPQESATLGTFSSDPEAHIHPEWMIIVPTGVIGDYEVSFTLRGLTPGFGESPVYGLTLTNRPAPPTPTATVTATFATPTPSPPGNACAGDCDGDGTVTVDEIVRAVTLALGDPRAEPCPPADTSNDGMVTVDEIVAAIDSALNGCPT
jgi:hypothetical protein